MLARDHGQRNTYGMAELPAIIQDFMSESFQREAAVKNEIVVNELHTELSALPDAIWSYVGQHLDQAMCEFIEQANKDAKRGEYHSVKEFQLPYADYAAEAYIWSNEVHIPNISVDYFRFYADLAKRFALMKALTIEVAGMGLEVHPGRKDMYEFMRGKRARVGEGAGLIALWVQSIFYKAHAL